MTVDVRAVGWFLFLETPGMAELFKFRCYQCQKLIGALPSRFGSVVKCPRCGVELVVPFPDEADVPAEGPDLDTFRPEALGLVLDPGPIGLKTTETRPSPAPTPAPVGPDPIAFLERTGSADPEQDEPSGDPVEDDVDPSDLPEVDDEPIAARPRARGRRMVETLPRARDVVLPRTAVVAWSLFAILALGFAFTTGLFVGQRMGR